MKRITLNIMRALLAVGSFAAALGGCVTQPAAPVDCRVTVAPELATRIWVRDLRLARESSQQFTMQAALVNSSRSICRLDYRVVWLDASGIEIPSVVSTWQKYSLAPMEVGTIYATAPSPMAVDFRFYVKESR